MELAKPVQWVNLVVRSLLLIGLLGFSFFMIYRDGLQQSPFWTSVISFAIGLEMDSTYARAFNGYVKNETIRLRSRENTPQNTEDGSSE